MPPYCYTRLKYWLILARVLVGMLDLPMAYTLWGIKGLGPIGMYISILLNAGYNKPKGAILKGCWRIRRLIQVTLHCIG